MGKTEEVSYYVSESVMKEMVDLCSDIVNPMAEYKNDQAAMASEVIATNVRKARTIKSHLSRIIAGVGYREKESAVPYQRSDSPSNFIGERDK